MIQETDGCKKSIITALFIIESSVVDIQNHERIVYQLIVSIIYT